jgi:outer membrane protein OmpA-like peptidoglycan-associated protein
LPDDVVVLLDDPAGGGAGAVEVRTATGSTTIDQGGQAFALDGTGSKATPLVPPAEEVQSVFGDALLAKPEKPETFIVYFEFDTDVLTGVSKALFPDILEAIRRRTVVDVSVVGHTDRAGDDVYNYQLSSRRASAVRDTLVAEGVDPSVIEIEFHGENNPLIETDDEIMEPRNRRVGVTVR